MEVETNNNLFAEAVEMQNEINALRKELEQVKRERDAAVKDLHRVARDGQICAICKYEGGSCDERQFAEMECWQWRGVQEVER